MARESLGNPWLSLNQ